MGRDFLALRIPFRFVVSTHAPAWGATRSSRSPSSSNSSFNPRARMGRDVQDLDTQILSHGFNPRARMGRDERLRPSADVRVSFNPRARMGRDIQCSHSKPGIKVSTHAPAWGATSVMALPPLSVKVSTHAPAWGATDVTALR